MAPATGASPAAFRVAFSLPRGPRVGGVEIWSARMCQALRGQGVLLNHRPAAAAAPQVTADQGTGACELPVTGRFAQKVQAYRQVLPAVLVPNLMFEPYEICAALTGNERDAASLRILGMCHNYEEYYFLKLCYYEPVIHRFIAVSEECAQVLRGRMPQRAADVLVRPYGVEVPPSLSRTYSGGGEPLRLLYAGRMVQRQKRVLDLLRLAEQLAARGVDFALDVVGDGPEKAVLAQRLARLPQTLRQRVTLAPPVAAQSMPALLRQHDLCVLVSEFEGTSLFMLEGMAHGCVPVVTRVSGTAAVVRDGANGYVVPVGDPATMAERIAGLAADRLLLTRLGRQARQTAEQFSMASYLEWFGQVVAEVWREPPRLWPGHRPWGLRLRRMAFRLGEQTRHIRLVRWAHRRLVQRPARWA